MEELEGTEFLILIFHKICVFHKFKTIVFNLSEFYFLLQALNMK